MRLRPASRRPFRWDVSGACTALPGPRVPRPVRGEWGRRPARIDRRCAAPLALVPTSGRCV